ncbi:sensor histidine kinase [Streptomyces sp. NPDC046862]|uniref:sensor histidine kinase n=1 Tax=Streptomyces sp. NPDC046862 TaxID=3154603 RepID=UPI003456CFE5
MRPPSTRGCTRGFGAGALFAASALDLAVVNGLGDSHWPTVCVLLVGLTCVLWPARWRPAWLTPQVRTLVPAMVSVLLTAVAAVTGRPEPAGPGELTVLLCLLFVAVRHCPPRWAVVCGVLNAVALLAMPERVTRSPWLSSEALLYEVVGLLLIGATAGVAGYVRSLDYRRTVTEAETRRAERLAIAADLHDFVAHHVTGILVQTQVARMMAATRPDELDPVLGSIEHAATQALASMRRTVGVLRDTGHDAAERRPVGDLAGITELTEHFAVPGQNVVVHRDPALPDDLPYEVQAAAFRVVQEALTNVRRHAGDATEITVALGYDGGLLTVTVTDDGRGGTQLPGAAHGGGFGIVGLTERVSALDGELRAGPRSGQGWQVRAHIPVGIDNPRSVAVSGGHRP